MARPIIDIGMRIDISDQIADIEKQLNGLANKAGGKMTKEVSNQIAALESELKNLQDSFTRLNTSKLSTKTFQSATKEITLQIAELDKRTTALESGMSELIRTMSATDGGAMANALKQVSAQMDAVKKNAQDATKAVGNMVSSFEGSANVRISTGQDEGSLKKELKELQQLSQAIEKIRNDDLYSPYKGSLEDYSMEIDALYSKYNDIMNKMSEDNLDVDIYNSLRNELIKTSTAFSTLYNAIPDDFFDAVSGKKFSGTPFGDIAEIIKDDLSGLQLEISSRIDAINTTLSNIGEGTTIDNVKNKLTVPLDISTSQTTLLKRAKDIIDGVQPYLNNYPLKIQFILQSGYSSKKTNSLLSQMQKEINELPDEVNKSGIQELYDKIAKDFNKELNLRISADALEPTEKKIITTIERIRKTVQEPMKITPEIVIDDTNIAEVQSQLNKISKNLSLSIDKLELSADAKKTAKNSSAAKEIKESNQNVKIANESIDAILAKISDVEGSLSPITKLLLDIRQLLQFLPGDVGSIQEPINGITASVKELTSLLQSSIQVLSSENLDDMFAKIQRSINSISGSLRGKNLDKIRDILAEFKKYRALGGTASITDLGGADNIQNWLKKHYLDTGVSKNTAVPTESSDLSALLARLNEVSEAIAKKTSLFEEEKNSVNRIIPEECEKLNLLGDIVGVITDNLTALNEQFKARKLTTWGDKFKDVIGEIAALINGTVGNGDVSKILDEWIEADRMSSTTSGSGFLDSFINKIKEAKASVSDLADATKALDGASSIDAESKSMDNLADNSGKASQSKKAFAEANGEVIASIIAALKSIDSEGKAFESLSKIITKFSGKNGKSNADSTVGALERIRDVLKSPIDDNSMVKALENIAAQGTNLEHLATIIKASKKQLEQASEMATTGKVSSTFDSSILSYVSANLKRIETAERTRANANTAYTQEFNAQITAAKQKLEELNAVIKKHPEDTPWDDSELSNIKVMQDEVDRVVSSLNNQENILETSNALDKLSTRISKTLNDNTNMSAELRAAFIDLRKRIDDSRDSIDKVSFKRLTSEFQALNAQMEKSGQTGRSFLNQISRAITSQSAQFIATYMSFQDIIRYAREVVNTVTQIDSALTELRKVSDASTERLAQNFEVSAETAEELGASITHVINMTADWSRLGYSVDEAEKLARITTLFQNVGDNMSADDASSYMISTLQGFQLATEEAERIVDVYNEVANNFAIDTRGIGEAISRSAASFNAANTELEGAVAVITAANSVVQNPEAIGTAMKTLSARIRGSKVELEELGEEEEDVVNLTSKLRKEVQAMTGFDIMEDEETYKSIDQIIIGIGKHWEELTDIQQAALAEDLAGKRNANVMISLLQNAELVEDVYKRALDAEGSAIKEQENYEKSIQYSLDRFSATLQELEADLVNSQTVKSIVDIGTTILDVIDSIVENIGLLGTGAAVAGLTAFIKNFGSLKETFTTAQNLLDVVDSLAEEGQSWEEALELVTGATKGLNYAQAEQILAHAGVEAAERAEILSAAGLTAANGTATISFEALTAAIWGSIKSLASFLITNPVGWCILAASAVAGVVVAYDALTVSVAESKEKIDKYNSSIESLTSELENLRSLESKTAYDNDRIAYLEKELELQQKLLEVEQRRYYTNQTEKSFANYFDKDNVATQQLGDSGWLRGLVNVHSIVTGNSLGNALLNLFAPDTSEDIISEVKDYTESLKEIDAEITNLQKVLDGGNIPKSESDYINNRLGILEEQKNSIINDKGLKEYGELLNRYKGYIEQEKRLNDALNAKDSDGNNLLVGEARTDALDELNAARERIEGITEALRQYENAIHDYDPFNGITGIASEDIFNEAEIVKAISSTGDLEDAQKRLLAQFPSLAGLCSQYGITLEELVVHYRDVKESADEASESLDNVKKELSFTQSISDLNDLESALNNVGNAIANIDENGKFQLGDLDQIADYFLALEQSESNVEYETEAVANALKLLGEGTGDINAQADAINTLADNYLHTSNILDGLNEKNKELYIIRLQEMGIINAEEIVTASLNNALNEEARQKAIVAAQSVAEAQAKELVANETVDLTTLTAEEINALIEEGTITKETALKLLELAIQKQAANGTVLSTSGDISNLTALCSSLGVAGSALERYAEMKRIAMDTSGTYTPEYQAGTLKRANQMLQNAIKSAYNSGGAQLNVPKVQYNGGSPVKSKLGYTPSSTADAISGTASKAAKDAADAASKAAKEAEDSFKEVFDYFERLIKTLDNSISLLKAHLEDVVGSFAKNTLLDAQEDLIKKKMDGYASAIGMYSQKASEALSKIPSEVAAKIQNGAVAIDEFVGESNKDVVDAIGDYEQWADKVADCKQQIVELREELRQLELQKFKNVAQDFTELFDRRQSAIDSISKAISLFETASDKVVGRGFYDVSIDQTEKQLNHLNEERDALVAQMNSAIAAGINVAGDEWFEMLEVLEDLDGQILDSQKNIEDFKNAIISLYVEGFDRWNDRYTKQIELRTKAISALQKQISVIQESGNLTGEAYIQEQITQTQKQLSMLQHEREELVKRMSDATENGVRVGTDEWYSMVDALNSVDSAIQDCEESIESLDNAILALHTETFERIQNRFSSISDEISNMADMFSDFDVATKDNKWTSEGLAQLGLLGEQYELTKRRVEQYNEEIAELNKQYSDGKYSATEYAENLAQLKSAQWDQVKANKAARDSMIELNKARVDIVVEGINEETEAYAKLVEQEKETLSSEQDLHNYRKQIADANKSIVEIQRQLAALEGDNSQVATAKRLKLEEELADAREELAEQEYEHSITSQQEALDQQLEDYQAARELEIEALQTTLDNEQQILTDTFAAIKENSFLIGQEILTMAQTLNITMSPEITAPWQSGENAIASYGALLNAESSNFILRLGEVESAEWRLQEQANSSSGAIANMFANQSDNLVSQTEMANEQFRQEEQAAWSASNAIANAFGQRADGLVATIENARNSAQNLSAMSDALANSLSNSIDGSYSGAGAQSALNGIADAANGVAAAANDAANALRSMMDAQNAANQQPKEHVTSIYGGPNAGKVAVWTDRNGSYKFRAKGSKSIPHDEIAWTQEQGPEMILSPTTGAILTPLQKGDSVLPTMQTENIWEWSKFNPTDFAKQLIQNIPNTGGNVQTNTMQVGSLVTITGPVNDTVEMVKIASQQASAKIKQSFNELSNGLNR